MTAAQRGPENLRPWVRAQVIDVRRPDPPGEEKYLLDTNVLYFIHYDRVANLDALGEGPLLYQIQQYPRYVQRALERKSRLFVHRMGLMELARRIETAELQILYAVKTPGVIEVPADIRIKDLRTSYPEEYRTCQARVLTYLAAVRKTCQAIPATLLDEHTFWTHWEAGWQQSVADSADIAQAVDALAADISAVISDDSDWVSIAGIRLYTANQVSIQAARLAGRLLR
jgi:hypothetical protein